MVDDVLSKFKEELTPRWVAYRASRETVEQIFVSRVADIDAFVSRIAVSLQEITGEPFEVDRKPISYENLPRAIVFDCTLRQKETRSIALKPFHFVVTLEKSVSVYNKTSHQGNVQELASHILFDVKNAYAPPTVGLGYTQPRR